MNDEAEFMMPGQSLDKAFYSGLKIPSHRRCPTRERFCLGDKAISTVLDACDSGMISYASAAAILNVKVLKLDISKSDIEESANIKFIFSRF